MFRKNSSWARLWWNTWRCSRSRVSKKRKQKRPVQAHLYVMDLESRNPASSLFTSLPFDLPATSQSSIVIDRPSSSYEAAWTLTDTDTTASAVSYDPPSSEQETGAQLSNSSAEAVAQPIGSKTEQLLSTDLGLDLSSLDGHELASHPLGMACPGFCPSIAITATASMGYASPLSIAVSPASLSGSGQLARPGAVGNEQALVHALSGVQIVSLSNGNNDQGPLIFQDTIRAAAPGATTVRVVKGHSANHMPPGGFVGQVHARAYNKVGNGGPGREQNLLDDVRTGSGLTPYLLPGGALGGPYSTRLLTTSVVGEHFVSSAKAVFTVSAVTPTQNTWTANGTTISVSKVGTGQVGPDRAIANYTMFDPFTVGIDAGTTFDATVSPNGEWSIWFMDPSLVDGSATISGSFGSDLPGLEQLASWSISLTSGGSVNATFMSNLLLGYDDGAISQQLQDGFSFDPSSATWTYGGEGINISWPVPAGYNGDTATITDGIGMEFDAVGRASGGCRHWNFDHTSVQGVNQVPGTSGLGAGPSVASVVPTGDSGGAPLYACR